MIDETEGVIKYTLDHQIMPIQAIPSLTSMNAWRTVFHQLGLIGQDKQRYQGYGYGNISQRIKSDQPSFMISGTQTGLFETLSAEQYCQVITARPDENYIRSEGLIKPSSEALTHASIYHHSTAIQSVIHIHCPLIWQSTSLLQLPSIDAKINYGTPAMAKAVGALLQTPALQQQTVFSLLGHLDGIIAFGESMDIAAHRLIQVYYQAMAIKQSQPAC